MKDKVKRLSGIFGTALMFFVMVNLVVSPALAATSDDTAEYEYTDSMTEEATEESGEDAFVQEEEEIPQDDASVMEEEDFDASEEDITEDTDEEPAMEESEKIQQ